jgi:hypothetical protein
MLPSVGLRSRLNQGVIVFRGETIQVKVTSGGAAPPSPDTPVARPETPEPRAPFRARGSLFCQRNSRVLRTIEPQRQMPRRAGRRGTIQGACRGQMKTPHQAVPAVCFWSACSPQPRHQIPLGGTPADSKRLELVGALGMARANSRPSAFCRPNCRLIFGTAVLSGALRKQVRTLPSRGSMIVISDERPSSKSKPSHLR